MVIKGTVRMDVARRTRTSRNPDSMTGIGTRATTPAARVASSEKAAPRPENQWARCASTANPSMATADATATSHRFRANHAATASKASSTSPPCPLEKKLAAIYRELLGAWAILPDGVGDGDVGNSTSPSTRSAEPSPARCGVKG